MRKLLCDILPRLTLSALFALLLLCTLGQSCAEDKTLQWDAVEDAARYVIYYGLESRYNPCISNLYGSNVNVPLTNDENPDPDIFEYTVSGLLDDETYFFAVKAVDDNNFESAYSNEEAILCITCDDARSCDTPSHTATFYVNADEGCDYTVRGRADANTQVILSDEHDNAWSTQADSERNWAVADLNFESLYGKSDQYVTFSVESGDVTSRVVTATFDVTDPASNAELPVNKGWYLQIPWEADDTLSGLGSVELWCKGPVTDKWFSTWLSQGDTDRDFYYIPDEGDGTYYFATRSVDKAGNWEEEPWGDGDTSIYYTAPAGPGSWSDGHTGKEGGGGGCFIDALLPPAYY